MSTDKSFQSIDWIENHQRRSKRLREKSKNLDEFEERRLARKSNRSPLIQEMTKNCEKEEKLRAELLEELEILYSDIINHHLDRLIVDFYSTTVDESGPTYPNERRYALPSFDNDG